MFYKIYVMKIFVTHEVLLILIIRKIKFFNALICMSMCI